MAVIFDISRYMIQDGPGIRTGVFFKGCPLRCKWCSNPYGFTVQPVLAYANRKCTGCGACVTCCPSGANKILDGVSCIDRTKCTACGKCESVCPSNARTLVGKEMTPEEIIDLVQRDQAFYRRNSGGLTLSGGEILAQPEEAVKILYLAKEHLIHRAIETSAYGSWEALQQILLLTHWAFIDIKHILPEKHRALTGVDNSRILDNIEKAAVLCHEKKKRLVIRVPVIPGLNDEEENIRGIAQFVSSLCDKPLINLLPYHSLGMEKYDRVGYNYELKDIQAPKNDRMAIYRDWVLSYGCSCTVGGYKMSDQS